MQKFAVVTGIASVLGLIVGIVTLMVPSAAETGDQYNYGPGGQNIETVNGGVRNDLRQYHTHASPPPRKPRVEDNLPPGFSLDEDGFVLGRNKRRICQTTSTPHSTSNSYDGIQSTMTSWDYHTSCKMWDGSWAESDDIPDYLMETEKTDSSETTSNIEKLDEWLGLKRK